MAQLIGAGPVALPSGGTSEVYTTPYPLVPGTRAFDTAGNEFVFCDYTGTVYGGTAVVISGDGNFTAASAGAGTSRGAVGIATAAGTSDNAGWVQIYGYNSAVQLAGADSAATSSYILVNATSVSSPATAVDARSLATSDAVPRVFGAWPVAAASTATTSATSATGVTIAVFLNYPMLLGQDSDLATS